MLEIAFWVIVGAFIGWNIPQPAFAKSIQDKYLSPAFSWIKKKLHLG